MNFSLGHSCFENIVPERRGNAKTFLLSSKVMLIMILLKFVEPTLFVLACVDVVQRVMNEIVDQVPNNKSNPKGKSQLIVFELDQFIKSEISNCHCNEGQSWRENNTVTE